MIRKHFRLRRLVLGLAFAALLAPAAQAKPVPSPWHSYGPVSSEVSSTGGVTPSLSQLEAQANAMIQRSRLDSYNMQLTQSSLHGGTTPTLAQLQAQAAQYRAKLDKSAITEVAVVSSGGGFDWNDAGIGAGVVFGGLLLLTTLLGLARSYRGGRLASA